MKIRLSYSHAVARLLAVHCTRTVACNRLLHAERALLVCSCITWVCTQAILQLSVDIHECIHTVHRTQFTDH
jgi:hypothetical protein